MIFKPNVPNSEIRRDIDDFPFILVNVFKINVMAIKLWENLQLTFDSNVITEFDVTEKCFTILELKLTPTFF